LQRRIDDVLPLAMGVATEKDGAVVHGVSYWIPIRGQHKVFIW
jgi:hypothetical protein